MAGYSTMFLPNTMQWPPLVIPTLHKLSEPQHCIDTPFLVIAALITLHHWSWSLLQVLCISSYGFSMISLSSLAVIVLFKQLLIPWPCRSAEAWSMPIQWWKNWTQADMLSMSEIRMRCVFSSNCKLSQFTFACTPIMLRFSAKFPINYPCLFPINYPCLLNCTRVRFLSSSPRWSSSRLMDNQPSTIF